MIKFNFKYINDILLIFIGKIKYRLLQFHFSNAMFQRNNIKVIFENQSFPMVNKFITVFFIRTTVDLSLIINKLHNTSMRIIFFKLHTMRDAHTEIVKTHILSLRLIRFSLNLTLFTWFLEEE